MSNPYHESDSDDMDSSYQLLIGPDGFECVLTEPEDRIWSRDLVPVVRELNRQAKVIAKLEAAYAAQQDPTRDLIAANQETTLEMYKTAIRRIRACLRRGKEDLAFEVIVAVQAFHPMHGESWQGWPEGSEP